MKYFAIFCFLVALGCAQGTGTGNPRRELSGSPVSSTGSGIIFNAACSQVATCHPEITFDDCWNAIAIETTFAPRLGLSLSPAPTVDETIALEAAGTISPAPAAQLSCKTAILGLSCSDPLIVNAYDASLGAGAFSGVVNVLDPVCAGVFGP